MKTAIASLQERLIDWTPIDKAIYEYGACLGLWSEFGASPGEDPWHGLKDHITSNMPFYEIALDGLVDNLAHPILEYKFEFVNGVDTLFYRAVLSFQSDLERELREKNLKAFW